LVTKHERVQERIMDLTEEKIAMSYKQSLCL